VIRPAGLKMTTLEWRPGPCSLLINACGIHIIN